MIIGFDFDNTLIDYTNSFKKLVKKKKLVPEKFNKNKIAIRNYLREKNLENKWTILQGEIYGNAIMDAEIYDGVKNTFQYILQNNIKIKIVSHKTQYPYMGRKVDLRLSALKWIEKNILNQISNTNFSKSDIFFENTINDKIKKIQELCCDIYVDDLPEILNLLPNKIQKILFSPISNNYKNYNYKVMQSWTEFKKIINLK
ncbi:hypothetical protein N9F75_02115 [Candidatus Pelagibacter ubique]|nr:hypothetical protein [Candidatus Pelagibacter ubique]